MDAPLDPFDARVAAALRRRADVAVPPGLLDVVRRRALAEGAERTAGRGSIGRQIRQAVAGAGAVAVIAAIAWLGWRMLPTLPSATMAALPPLAGMSPSPAGATLGPTRLATPTPSPLPEASSSLVPSPDATMAPATPEFGVRRLQPRLVYDTSEMDPVDMVVTRGRDRQVFVVDRDSRAVWQIGLRTGSGEPVVRAGDREIGRPRLLALGYTEVVILDDRGDLWRWRVAGSGTLQKLRVPRDAPGLGDDVVAMDTYLIDEDHNVYNLYIPDPSAVQVHRYGATLAGDGFSDVQEWLATDNEDVAGFRDLYIDGSVYTLSADGLVRHFQGHVLEYELATPPDDADLRPGHDYRLVAEGDGRFFIYDAKWQRIVVFDKATAEYLEQWLVEGDGRALESVVGMAMLEPDRDGRLARLVWLTGTGLYQAQLADAVQGEPAASPSVTP